MTHFHAQNHNKNHHGTLRILLLYVYLVLNLLQPASCLDALLKRIRENFPNWKPDAIIDIGSNKGRWSKKAREHYPEAKLLLLEASNQHEKGLQDVVQKYLNKGESKGHAEFKIQIMGNKRGDEVKWFENGGSTGNSMFREDTKFYEGVVPIKGKTDTLDHVIQNSFLKNDSNSNGENAIVDYIKLDVQGAELLVLQGGTKTLAEASFVQVEYLPIEYNKGGSCTYEIDEFLRSNGYYLYDMGEILRNTKLFKTHGVGMYDAVYVRPASERLPEEFRNLGANFCGVGRTGTTNSLSTTASKEKRIEAMTDHSTESNNFDSVFYDSVYYFHMLMIFLIGVFLGKYKRKPRNKSNYLK